mmetsp:Transcript_83095/g.164842  ORF Transcript_83095/g.164842 Transcript_83095/m.164842 type:complete len:262 (-) Transcript_83095:37-822(-)
MTGLNRDLLRLNRALRLRSGQESQFAPATKRQAASLPEWLKPGSRCCYVSKSSGSTHSVKVKKIDERQQAVTIFFEQDPRTWKKVPFSECSKLGDGTLRPVWKGSAQVSTCAGPSQAPERPSASVGPSAVATSTAPAVHIVDDASGDELTGSALGPYPQAPELPPWPTGPPLNGVLVPRAVTLANSRRASAPQIGPEGPPAVAPSTDLANAADSSGEEAVEVSATTAKSSASHSFQRSRSRSRTGGHHKATATTRAVPVEL